MARYKTKAIQLASLVALFMISPPVAAQQTLLSDGVLAEDFQDFRGEGLAPGGAGGRLDANVWRVRLSPSIDTDFGYTSTENELARGVNIGTSGTGGLWAYTIGPDEYALGAQPTGTVFTDGHFETHVTNGTGGALDSIDIAFDFCWFNKQARSQFFRGQVRYPGTSGMNTSFFFMGATPGPADPDPQWECERVETTVDLTSSPLMPGATAEIRWFSNDLEGDPATGARDAVALNNVIIATTRCGNGVVSTGDACDDGTAQPVTECPYGVPTCSACSADCSMVTDLTGPYCGDGLVQPEHGEECDPAEPGGPECTQECELVDDPGGPGDAGDPEPDVGVGDDTGVPDAGGGLDAGTSDDVGGGGGDPGDELDAGTSDDAEHRADVGSSLDSGSTDEAPMIGPEAGCDCSLAGGSSPGALGLIVLIGVVLLRVRRRKVIV